MFAILFTVTFLISVVLLLRAVFKKHISARLQYAAWLLVAVKLLVFPMPVVEGDFSVLGLVAQDRQEGLSGDRISAEELAAAQESGLAQEEAQSGQADGNLWMDGGQMAENEDAHGTDTGATPVYIEVEGKGVSGLMHWCRTAKLHLLHYVETVLKVPMWSAAVLAAGSLLCAVWMTVYHVRLGRYLRRKRVALPEVRLGGAGEWPVRERVCGGNISGTGEDRTLFKESERSVGKGRLFRIYSVEGLPTPCLFGRNIYVPANLAENGELLPYILQHEMCHYFHGDAVWGLVRMVCVCLYWYHPLVWLAAYLSRQDCELACDEAAVKPLTGGERTRYGELLLKLAPVKGYPAECFSMTTAMSGSAKNLRQRLERITGNRRNWVIPGALAVLAGLMGIYACITNGVVSVDKQWQSIRIRREEVSIPVLQESYRLDYRLSKDAASYGLYLEEYEYGRLISAEVLDCAALRPEGEVSRKQKRGEALYTRTLEADETTGAFIKSVNSYSLPDYTALDGAGSVFKAFTLDLSEETAIGSSFSMAAEKQLEHRFRIGDDIILLASYYGDGRLSVPPGHVFETEKYRENTADILKSDSLVILVHLIVSDQSSEQLRKQIDEIVRKKVGGSTAQPEDSAAGGLRESGTDDSGADGYSNEQLQEMAENYFRSEHGYAPAHVEIDSENGKKVLIWLYDKDEFMNGKNEIVGSAHTGDWYTVDRMTGKGENVLQEEIDLTQAAPLTEPWSGAVEEMEVVDVREEEKFFALPAEPEAGAENRLYLLGETGHYRLYGAGDYQSLILEEQNLATEISVPFITDGTTMQPPGVQEADYDGDGAPELAVKLLWGGGTGFRQEQLWMFDREAGRIKAREYPGGAYAEELLKRLSFAEGENGKVIMLGGRQISPELEEEQGASYEEMRINTSRVSFAFTDGMIKLRTLISCGSREGSVMPAYGDGCLEAEVLYNGNRFFIRDVASADLKDVERKAGEAVRAYYAPRGMEIIDYNVGKWRLSEEAEEMEMTLTVLENVKDSYDYVTVPFVREETGQWEEAGEIWIEK